MFSMTDTEALVVFTSGGAWFGHGKRTEKGEVCLERARVLHCSAGQTGYIRLASDGPTEEDKVSAVIPAVLLMVTTGPIMVATKKAIRAWETAEEYVPAREEYAPD